MSLQEILNLGNELEFQDSGVRPAGWQRSLLKSTLRINPGKIIRILVERVKDAEAVLEDFAEECGESLCYREYMRKHK